MKVNIKRLQIPVDTSKISRLRIRSYRKALIAEMVKLGATKSELGLVCDDIIINSILNSRKAEDVAWAILQ